LVVEAVEETQHETSIARGCPFLFTCIAFEVWVGAAVDFFSAVLIEDPIGEHQIDHWNEVVVSSDDTNKMVLGS